MEMTVGIILGELHLPLAAVALGRQVEMQALAAMLAVSAAMDKI
tara:strand:- start:302 stop:433 length:132 start_codon:yes stop_codon:yes gene_type:complete